MNPILPTSWMDHPIFNSLRLTPGSILRAALSLLIAWALSKVLRRLIERSGSGSDEDRGLRYSIGQVAHYLVVSVGGVIALSALGVDISSLTVLGGALGIGLGFGLQQIVNNVVSGLVLLIERPIRVGDRISLGTLDQDTTTQINGYVSEIGLRATRVITPDNITLIVPNSEFVSRTVVNWSLANQRLRVRLTMPVAYGSDLDRVASLMVTTAQANTQIATDPTPEARLTGTGDSALEFTLLAWVDDPRLRGVVEADLRNQIVRAFTAAGIVMPLPQREVTMRDTK